MSEANPTGIAARVVGAVAIVGAVAPLAMPLQQQLPYAVPGRGVLAAVLCAAIAACLLWPRAPRFARWAAFAVSPVAFFLALYATLAELEEVVVLRAADTDLRLWIVDDAEGAQWVSMQHAKAETNGLDGARLQMQRAGGEHCVVPRIVDDAAANRLTFDLRQEKYSVQRLAVAAGLFGDGPGPTTITLRLDPCD